MTTTSGKIVLGAGLAAIAVSAVALQVTAGGEVRYSADHHDTLPMWHRWIPAAAGLLLTWLVFRGRPVAPAARTGDTVAWGLLGLGFAWAAASVLMRGGEPVYSLLKALLLVAIPLVLYRARRTPAAVGSFWLPAVPVAGWLLLTYATPLAPPAREADVSLAFLLAALVIGFAGNALLEEVFYRRWLQTAWEARLGPWPAIVLASVCWAVWHAGIQGGGDLPADLAGTLVNQGFLGLFLGYLWTRSRRMWPILTIHGALNAVPLLLGLM